MDITPNWIKELELLREFHKATKRMHNTHIVDDDYPEMSHYYQRARCNLDDFYKQESEVVLPDEKLRFSDLRQANIKRLPEFKNKHGDLAHSELNGSDWSRSDWLEAAVGELGEYANFSKKFRRGDIDAIEFKEQAKKELADAIIYLDILAFQLEINLDDAIKQKFNEVSKRVGVEIFL